MKPLFFVLFLFLASAITVFAQDSVFAADDNKTLSLVGGSDEAVGVEFIVRSPEDGVSYYSGEIAGDKSVVSFESSGYTDSGEEVAFPITLRFDGDNIAVIADYPDALPASSDPSGSYKKLTAKQHLAFAKSGFNVTDDALNARWSELKKIVPAELLTDLTERQKAWVEHRDYMTQHGAGEDFKSNPTYWESAWDMTQSRLLFLDIMLGTDVPPGIPGVYLDEYGGAINIVHGEGDKFRFQINVVRGPTFHSGEITNTVAISGGSGKFVDTDKEAFWEGQPCTIVFTFSGNRLVVEAENTAYYHGARAYFDGTYFKTVGEPEIVKIRE